MPNLIDIRRRIKSTKNTQQITKAMKMISASRLRRASERATNARPYAERIFEVHRSVLGGLSETKGDLFEQREGKTLLVVVAGDKGLCGAFNANIFKRADRLLKGGDAEHFEILPIGKKAIAHFSKSGLPLLEGYAGVFKNITFSLAEEISKRCMFAFTDGSFAKVVLVFNKFKNVLVQEVTEWQLLPLAARDGEDQAPDGMEHLAEPSLEAILIDLSPRMIMTRVFQGLLESCASEHAARMTAMDAATNSANDLIDRLTLEMNKARQAAITNELIEVVSGAAAL